MRVPESHTMCVAGAARGRARVSSSPPWRRTTAAMLSAPLRLCAAKRIPAKSCAAGGAGGVSAGTAPRARVGARAVNAAAARLRDDMRVRGVRQ